MEVVVLTAVVGLLGVVLRDPLRILLLALVLRALGHSKAAVAEWAMREAYGDGGDPPIDVP